jgi:hypothetical protein
MPREVKQNPIGESIYNRPPTEAETEARLRQVARALPEHVDVTSVSDVEIFRFNPGKVNC